MTTLVVPRDVSLGKPATTTVAATLGRLPGPPAPPARPGGTVTRPGTAGVAHTCRREKQFVWHSVVPAASGSMFCHNHSGIHCAAQ